MSPCIFQKNGFPNAPAPKKDSKQDKTFPKEPQVREQLRKEFHKLKDCVTDFSFMKNMDEWLSEVRSLCAIK